MLTDSFTPPFLILSIYLSIYSAYSTYLSLSHPMAPLVKEFTPHSIPFHLNPIIYIPSRIPCIVCPYLPLPSLIFPCLPLSSHPYSTLQLPLYPFPQTAQRGNSPIYQTRLDSSLSPCSCACSCSCSYLIPSSSAHLTSVHIKFKIQNPKSKIQSSLV